MSDKKLSNPFILSTDSFPGFGLDLIFSTAKDTGCDGIDLALWKNYDARHEDYVLKLSKNHNLMVYSVQTSAKVNAKELNKAVQICETTGAKHILINAPKYFDVKTYSFLTSNLHSYQEQYPDLTFSIINPDTASMAFLPFPKYRFKNIGEIIKKYHCKLGFDISNMDEDTIDTMIIGQGNKIVENISVCYVADRKKEKSHLMPGEGTYNLPNILKTLSKHKYNGAFSIKLSFDAQTLVNNEKVLFQIQKSIDYIIDNYK